MLIDNQNRLELESKVLAAAFKQGIDHGDLESADLAHKALFRLIRDRHLPNTTSDYIGYAKPNPNRFVEPAQTQVNEPVSPSIEPLESETGASDASLGTIGIQPQTTSLPITSESDDLEKANLAPANIYELLGVPQTSPMEMIHKNFLKQVRKVLVTKTKTKGVYPRKSLEMLRNLWIAHDILTDESIRADYDTNVLGLDSVAHPDPSRIKEAVTIPDSEDAASLRLGELLREAGLIDQTELEIACDMHKAMREMPFGRFLVKQDFIDEEQLEAVLIGQRLLREGLINLEQFQECMDTFTGTGKDLGQIVLETGYVTKPDLIKVRDRMRAEHVPTPPEPLDEEDLVLMAQSTKRESNDPQPNGEPKEDNEEAHKDKFGKGTSTSDSIPVFNPPKPQSQNPEVGDDSDSELAGIAVSEFGDFN